MSAVIRVIGDCFVPEAFFAESVLVPGVLFNKGEKRGRGFHATSGAYIFASEAELDEFPRQVEEATAFLAAHREELRRLRVSPGVEEMNLDFGIDHGVDIPGQFLYLPLSLLSLAVDIGLEIELSVYSCSPNRATDESPEA